MTLENKMEKDDHCQLNDNDPKLNNHLQPYFVGYGPFLFSSTLYPLRGQYRGNAR
jgi:hypothetical protein